MGGGEFSPKPDAGTTGTEQPAGTNSPGDTVGEQRGSNGATAAAVSNTLDGGGKSGVEEKRENGAFGEVGFNRTMFAAAANVDRGYSQEFAVRVRNMSDEELLEQFESDINAIGGNEDVDTNVPLNDKTRFIGGVLVSRSGNDFTAEDVFGDIEGGYGTAIENIDGKDYQKDVVFQQLTETFQQMDEYVAGQVASQIEEIKIAHKEDAHASFGDGTMKIDPDSYLGGSEQLGGIDYRELSFDEFGRVINKENNTRGWNLVAHESAHAFHQSLGITSTERQAPHKEDIPPDELTLDPEIKERERGDFPRREEFVERFEQHAENMVETLKADKSEMSEVDSVLKPIRDYQTANFAEMVAVGFDTYTSDVVLATNKQREIVDTFDDFTTGDEWTETSVDDLADHGVSIHHPQKNDTAHISSNDTIHRMQERDEVESEHTYGQVALFELNEEIAPGRDYVAGYVDEVTDDEVTVTYLENKVTIPRSKIDGVKERKEMKEECIERAEEQTLTSSSP